MQQTIPSIEPSFQQPLIDAIRKDRQLLQANANNHEFIKSWFDNFDPAGNWGKEVFEQKLSYIGITFKYDAA